MGLAETEGMIIADYIDAINLGELESETVDEVISAVPSRMLAATIGYDAPAIEADMPIAPLAHWLHCLPIVAHGGLDENGHPKRGRYLPDIPYVRRMFAGSTVKFIQPMLVGEKVQRKAYVTEVVLKQGRSGQFVLLNLHQVFTSARGELIREDQKIVYREPLQSSASQQKDPVLVTEAPAWSASYLPEERMLFRYSALLFSAHRIHFDRDFSHKEGYPALVVHGQLVASCLARLATESSGRELAEFSYRSTSPLFEQQKFTVCGAPDAEGARLWAHDARGVVCMQGRATFKP